jgi:hypothetical protein
VENLFNGWYGAVFFFHITSSSRPSLSLRCPQRQEVNRAEDLSILLKPILEILYGTKIQQPFSEILQPFDGELAELRLKRRRNYAKPPGELSR